MDWIKVKPFGLILSIDFIDLYIFLLFWGNERRQKPNIPHLGELILKFLVQFFSHLSFNFNSLPVQKWPLCMYCTAAGELYSFFIWWLSMLFFPPLLCDQQVFRFFMLFLHCTVSKTIAHFIIMVQFLQCDMYDVWSITKNLNIKPVDFLCWSRILVGFFDFGWFWAGWKS